MGSPSKEKVDKHKNKSMPKSYNSQILSTQTPNQHSKNNTQNAKQEKQSMKFIKHRKGEHKEDER